jgi:predicted O-methyltransferase YrrM
MFHTISTAMQERMRALEAIDARDRGDGTPLLKRLRQIPTETGQFLALLASTAPKGEVVEVGTSAGYSTMWLSLSGRKITTFEVLPEKAALARETFRLTGLDGQVNSILGDARKLLDGMNPVGFCFLDAEKDVYQDCYEKVVPLLVSGGLLAADNVTSHQDQLQDFVDHVLADRRVDALVVPIAKGVLVCRKI